MSQPYTQVFIANGDKIRIEKILNLQPAVPAEKVVTDTTLDEPQLLEKAKVYLKNVISNVIELPANEIESDRKMEEYGVDSIVMLKFSQEISDDFPDISRTVLFEYPTIDLLANYLLKEHQTHLKKALKVDNVVKPAINRN